MAEKVGLESRSGKIKARKGAARTGKKGMRGERGDKMWKRRVRRGVSGTA